jgi:lipid A 4'-phosphatase
MKSAPRCFGVSDNDDRGERKVTAPLLVPVALLVALSGWTWWGDLDSIWQQAFWSRSEGWFLKNHPVVQFLYHFGTWPALAAGGLGAVLALFSWSTGDLRAWRSLGLFLSLLLIIGPGLLVNVVFKDHFGRARPAQTQEFGGKLSFSPLGQRGYAGAGKSFPCGHASMGFYWLGLFVFFWERRRSLAWTFGVIGLVHGAVMGLGRMAQGGHWASDVVWSAAFVYFTAWGLQRLLPSQPIGEEAHR